MHTVLAIGTLLFLSLSAQAQDSSSPSLNLLDEKGVPGPLQTASPDDQADSKQDTTVIVPGHKLQDELPVGPTNKPMWTGSRPSPTTRIYLQVDPGEVEFEQWFDIRINKDHQVPTEVRMSEEFEFGLGSRFQLDLYANTVFESSGQNSTTAIRSWAGEIRYALADWGVLWANPTLYLEYIIWNNQPDAHADGAAASIEGKLLLGDELGNGWRWGSNLFLEHTMNGSVLETGLTLSVMRTIVDRLLSAGFASEYVYESDGRPLLATPQHFRTRGMYLGPSLQLRFGPYPAEVESNGVQTKITKTKGHLDLEPIFGLTGESDRARVMAVFGWDF
ncbi:MAG TPA: hypothetical protein VMU54_20760 [Planctomycetota bacterium]|nr:hypothetical protein [Planctomycetota bacterium]